MNRWGIPAAVEEHVLIRDTACVYCRIAFNSCGTRKSKPSWEHIVNDIRMSTRQNIALCCVSCNSSKGSKALPVWLESKYCKVREISSDTVAEVVKLALVNPPTLEGNQST